MDGVYKNLYLQEKSKPSTGIELATLCISAKDASHDTTDDPTKSSCAKSDAINCTHFRQRRLTIELVDSIKKNHSKMRTKEAAI